MAATVDVISGGRLDLGLGAGWNQRESGAYGIELDSLRERFDRFDEACHVLLGPLSQITDAPCEPKRPRTPHPPHPHRRHG